MTEKLSVSELTENYGAVRKRLSEALERAGRRENEVTLLAATKTVDPETINRAIELGVEMIESVHSEKLAAEISKQACKAGIIMDVLLEVNIGYEESKSGFAPEETEAAVRKIAEMPGISVKGLMAIPPIDPLYENTRKYFRNMYKLFIDIGAKNIDNSSMSVLSMGMSNDFDIAAEEGATIVRVGTALFGKRIYK